MSGQHVHLRDDQGQLTVLTRMKMKSYVVVTLALHAFDLSIIASIQGRRFFHKGIKGIDDIVSRHGMPVGKTSFFS